VSRGIHSARPGSGPPLLQRRQVGGRATNLRSHKYKPTSLKFNILHYPLCHLFNRFPLVDIILHDDESRLPSCRLTVRLRRPHACGFIRSLGISCQQYLLEPHSPRLLKGSSHYTAIYELTVTPNHTGSFKHARRKSNPIPAAREPRQPSGTW
jgi:hypothetical protein